MGAKSIDLPRVALVGPTASGKTAVGIALAQRLDTEIISADSMQVYRQMDIGTAKPTRDEQSQAVFHAVDVVDPDQDWTLADFQSLAEQAAASISARGRRPLIVGGTGLYIRALTTRLDIPNVAPNAEARALWQHLAAEQGNPALQAELARVDPEAAQRIHGNDVKRMIRALEVHAATGIALSEWHARNRAQGTETDAVLFGVHYAQREALYARIEDRVDAMMALGFLHEVQALQERGYGRELKAMQSLGYRHLAAALAGETSLEDAVAALKQDTRRFAKRQLIWFRADPRIHWLEAEGKAPETLADEIWVLLNG
jgi:tRNA dimethylallyltransferase